MGIRYVENMTDFPQPLPAANVQEAIPPDYQSMFYGDDFDRRGPVPPLKDGTIPLTEHWLRPNSRLYWVEGEDIPLPPDHRDPKWQGVIKFLLGHPNDRPPISDMASSYFGCWTAKEIRDNSMGQWFDTFETELYPWAGTPWTQVPPYLRVGATPWANGVSSNGHYDIPCWFLEQYMATGDLGAWKEFVKIVLHQAGQGLNWKSGAWRYEKSGGVLVGDFYDDTVVAWSHTFPAGLLMFWHLTGELHDAVAKFIAHAHRHRTDRKTQYNGFYGPRRTAWFLRFFRCLHDLLGDEFPDDLEVTAFDTIATALQYIDDDGHLQELQGQPSFGQFTVPQRHVGIWSHALFVSEALPILTDPNFPDPRRADLQAKVIELGKWIVTNTQNTETGQIPYTVTISPDGSTSEHFWRGATHTAIALPGLAALSAVGAIAPEQFTKAVDYVLANLSDGPLGRNTGNGWDRRHGSGAPKQMADLAYGLRPWVLAWRKHLAG